MNRINIKPFLLAFIIASQVVTIVLSAHPGSRSQAATWYYNGKLWMFGGIGLDETATTEDVLSDMWSYDPTTNEWWFEMGDKVAGQQPSVSDQGTYAPYNNPGARRYMCSWTDATNTLWLFGGFGTLPFPNFPSDVWNYDPSLNQWKVALKGSYNSSYQSPYQIGPRFSHQCLPSLDGKFVFVNGGTGIDSTNQTVVLNDLWSYSRENNAWTFVSGNSTGGCSGTLSEGVPSSTDYPSCGDRMASWTNENSELYFINGRSDFYSYNEVLRYSVNDTAGYWTLFGHGDLTGRKVSGAVRDMGKAWLFGGYGTDISDRIGLLADLYEWDGTTWKYLTGPRTLNAPGSYPAQPGSGNSSTYPGSRQDPMMWLDGDGNLWLFGGSGFGEQSNMTGSLNDMWKYTMSTGVWTWIGGSKLTNQNGNYTNDPLSPAEPPSSPVAIEQPYSGPSSNVTEPDPGLAVAAKIAIGVVVPVVVIGVGLLVLLLLLKKRKDKKNKTKKTTTTSVPLSPVPKGSKYDSIQPKPNSTYTHIGGPDAMTPTPTSTSAQYVPVSDNRLISYTSITLDQEIGEGSFGKVYLGKLRTTKVAIKVANTKMSQDEFIREANFQLAIPPHPNIVQLLGISIDGPQPLVVLEYCNEGSLDKVLFEGDRLRTPAEQIALAEAVARGIDHLHQNNIVHRDLAVRNILLHKGEPKISDFGMSRKLKEVSQVGKTAATIGPLRWMAPEALGKQLYSTKSDVWSFGMILFEIVAHEEPHVHEDLISVAIKIRDEGYVPNIPNDCPQVLRQVMQMCWKMDPNERPDMGTICTMLESSATSN